MRKYRIYKPFIHLLTVILFSSPFAIFLYPPIPQDLTYHAFADSRELFTIPNFADVISNAPFLLVGIIGLWVSTRAKMIKSNERVFWLLFFAGASAVALGSAYYHLNPINQTLVWDRLPMTISFMSFFSYIIYERINRKFGLLLLPILLTLGIASVFYWAATDDLRPYALVQFAPLLWVPCIFYLSEGHYSGARYLVEVISWYALAKVLEYFDPEVFELTGDLVSGHSLKHVAAALAVYSVVRYLRYRK